MQLPNWLSTIQYLSIGGTLSRRPRFLINKFLAKKHIYVDLRRKIFTKDEKYMFHKLSVVFDSVLHKVGFNLF